MQPAVLDAKGSVAKPSVLKEVLQANKTSLMAFDNAIPVSFHEKGLPLYLAERFPGPRPRGFEQYLVPVVDLDPAIAASSPGRSHRSCIYDPVSGSTELGCIWSEDRRALFSHIDRGAIGFPAKLILCSPHMKVRGDVLPDLSHRRSDACQDA